jgi:hypothetical protein
MLATRDDLRGVKAPVTPGRDHRRPHPAVADGPVQRLLADSQQAGRLARADQLPAVTVSFEVSGELLDILRTEAPVAAWGDEGRLQAPLGDGTKNARPADAKAIC